jgi:glutamate--cysteine ligase
MTTLDQDAETARVLHNQAEVEERIRAICFKTGPPARLGTELEWTLHHKGAPDAPLDVGLVRHTLGSLETPEFPLPAGGRLTTEPGGQVEISSAPADSLAALHAAVTADLDHLTGLLDAAGLRLGEHGIDPHREPRRLLDTPRYTAMARVLDAYSPDGRTMMCSTAGLQVCLDAGPAAELPTRWAAVLALGPPLIALFANSGRHAGRDTGLASARMATWWGMDPRLTRPPAGPAADPAEGWVRYALSAPLVCVRREHGDWDPPPGVTLRDWVDGALPRPPTVDDLDYHLSTLFPPVRPRGYLEVRYLDAQPGAEWIVPVAIVAALLGDRATTEAALEIATPVGGCWVPAYRFGLRDPALRRTAAALVELAGGRLATTGLPPAVLSHVIETVERRLRDADDAEEQR